MDASIADDNAAGLDRLRTVVNGLSPEDLSVAMPAGWTVAAVLGHMAFWDLRAAEIVRRSAAQGVSPSPLDAHLANEAMRHLLLALPPEEAARLALSAAETAAAVVAASSDDLLAALGALGEDFWPRRCRHWHKHLDDIERALAAAQLTTPSAGDESKNVR
jgi:hypothetical protein